MHYIISHFSMLISHLAQKYEMAIANNPGPGDRRNAGRRRRD